MPPPRTARPLDLLLQPSRRRRRARWSSPACACGSLHVRLCRCERRLTVCLEVRLCLGVAVPPRPSPGDRCRVLQDAAAAGAGRLAAAVCGCVASARRGRRLPQTQSSITRAEAGGRPPEGQRPGRQRLTGREEAGCPPVARAAHVQTVNTPAQGSFKDRAMSPLIREKTRFLSVLVITGTAGGRVGLGGNSVESDFAQTSQGSLTVALRCSPPEAPSPGRPLCHLSSGCEPVALGGEARQGPRPSGLLGPSIPPLLS